MARLENRFQKANRILGEVVKATVQGGYLFTEKAVHEILLKKGFVEINEEIKDAEGNVATRATQTGIDELSTKGEESVPKEKKKMFEIENVCVEPKRRSGGSKSMYPFEQLEVGQSFFVPASEARPEPWKTLTGTVASANTRFSIPAVDENGNPVMRTKVRGPNKGESTQATVFTRKFAINKDVKDGVEGARIGRIA